LLVATVAEITRAIRVPLSVDLEGGYSDDPGAVGDTVAAVIGAGAVGINLEDGNRDVDVLCAKIEHARRAAERAGVALYLNARIDAFIRPGVPAERRVEETIARAARYRAAGASGIFAIGVTVAADIRTLAAAVKLPLNVLARAGLPPASELEKLGVWRLSSGSGLAEIMHGRIATLAREFLQTGNSATVTGGAMPYRDLNSLMTPL
jgi:2-methylisocitrate lyase-like PEP mutase family enzyme